MEYTKEQKIELFNKLPDNLKDVITSTDLPEKIGAISDKYNLMVDNKAILTDEIVLLILGATSQKNFVPNISKKMNLGSDVCFNIAKDVNREIFDEIRSSLRESGDSDNTDNVQFNEPEAPKTPTPIYSAPIKKPNPVVTTIPTYMHPPEIVKDIPNIEKVGDFTIEKASVPAQNIEINKEEVLKGIEEPENIPSVSMIDHLLNSPVNSKERVVEKKIEIKEKIDKNTNNTADPYREQI